MSRAPAALARGRRAAGMSFIEMLVALAIVSIVLLVAGALLVRLSRQAQQQARRAPAVGGVTDRALDQLEQDVRRCAILREVREGHGERQLVLDMADGERVIWRHAGEVLRRGRIPLGGEPFEREVAGDVSLVEWNRRSAHLVDLRLRRSQETLRQRTVLLRNVDRVSGGGP